MSVVPILGSYIFFTYVWKRNKGDMKEVKVLICTDEETSLFEDCENVTNATCILSPISSVYGHVL